MTAHNALVAHSGGPTPVINASLLGTVLEARQHPSVIRKLFGAKFGIPGILNESFIALSAQPESVLQKVGVSTASALGCSRHEVTRDDFLRVLDVFRRHDIGIFFYTGGNGSMGTALQLQQTAEAEKYPLQIIGIPKTIDNDLLETDHTPGYPSTARFFANAVRDIGADNWSLPNQVEVIEVLGRNVGWIAAATALAKSNPDDAPHLIYFPEERLPLEKLFDDVSAVFHRLKRCVVVVCEGQLDEHDEPFGADVRGGSRGSLAQNLGHRLSRLISERLALRARSEKPGLLGRSSSAYVTRADWEEARLCGARAVELAVQGRSGVMVTLGRAELSEAPLESVAFKERIMPAEWRDQQRAWVRAPFLDFATPLIGEIAPIARLIE